MSLRFGSLSEPIDILTFFVNFAILLPLSFIREFSEDLYKGLFILAT